MNLSINQVVRHRCQSIAPEIANGVCRQTTHVIALHLRVTGRSIVGTEPFDLRTPFLALVAKGERDANDGCKGPQESYWCHFDGDVVQAQPGGKAVTLQAGNLHLHRSHFRLLTPKEAEVTTRSFEELRSYYQKPDLASQLQAHAVLMQILCVWAQPPPQTRESQTKVQLYRTLIEQYADDPHSCLRALAAEVGVTTDCLAVLFRSAFGMSPVEYRTQLRLSRAAEMLHSSVLPVTEIARLSGFIDPNYFARIFRKTYRCSPRQYATTHRLRGTISEPMTVC